MKIRWGSLFLSAVFSVPIIAAPVRATLVRVDAVGQEGLMPDDESDLNVASAFVYDVKSPRLFTTLGFHRDRSVETHTPSDKRKDRTLSASSSLEYVGAAGAWPFALRYAPSYSERKFEDAAVYYSVSRIHSRANLRVILGLGGGERWKLAIAPAYSDRWRRNSTISGVNRSRDESKGLEGSLMWGEKGSARTAVSLSGNVLRSRTDDLMADALLGKSHESEYKLSVVPELPFPAGTGRFLLRATSRHSDRDVPRTPLEELERALIFDAGAGFTGPAGAEGLWHTSLLFTRTAEGVEDIDVGDHSHVGSLQHRITWRLGAEKPVVRGVLLMTSINFLSYQDSRLWTNRSQRQYSANMDWFTGVSLGLGLEPMDSLRIDFNAASVTSSESDSHLRLPGTMSDSTSRSFSAEFEADYRF